MSNLDNFKGAICKKSCFFLSVILNMSNNEALGLQRVSHHPKASLFDKLGMRLKNKLFFFK